MFNLKTISYIGETVPWRPHPVDHCYHNNHIHQYCAGIPLFFNRSIRYSRLFLIETLLLSFQVLCLFVCFVVSVHQLSNGGPKEDYIKCELIGGGSPRQ